jgi:hypothetical protein
MTSACYFLANYWSTLGAALGLLFGASFFTILSFIILSKRLGISGWQALAPLMNSLCAVVALFLFIYFLSNSFNLVLYNWWQFIAAVILVGTAILVFLLF